MKKHAYLIMAHSNYGQLMKLLGCLDHERNDIYLHLDQKFKLTDKEIDGLTALRHSSVYLMPRLNIAWGGFTLIECEIELFKRAAEKADQYSYMHLISGLDLPLKDQDYIHAYMSEHQGEEFIEYMDEGYVTRNLRRLRYYYPIQEFAGGFRKEATRKRLYLIQRGFVKLQKLAGVDRLKKSNKTIKAGSQWVSLTSECASYIANNADSYVPMFKACSCGDEYFVQTVVANSKFYANIHVPEVKDGFHENMRMIIWENGAHPITYTIGDYDRLMSSDLLFARKFDENRDSEIIDKIVSDVRPKEQR